MPNELMSVSPELYSAIVQAFITALDDYTTDQRGDVGSWIRIAALHSLGRILPLSASIDNFAISEGVLQKAIGGTVRLAVEKLEPVRGEAARCLAELRRGGIAWEGMEYLLFQENQDRYVVPVFYGC
jgi:hypothetical protein